MYPNKIKEDLGVVANYMLGTAHSSELDPSGCLSKTACAAIDTLMLEAFEDDILAWPMPEGLTEGKNPDNKWRTVSCLQKAVRFGNRQMAMNAAHAAYGMDPAYLRYRLAVIAAEDVGAGNFPAVCIALAMMGAVKWRRSVDERRMLVWLADQLAAAPKDRTLVDLLVLAGHVESDKAALAYLPQTELLKMAAGEDVVQSVTCLHLAAGTQRFPMHGAPETPNRPVPPILAFMHEQGCSRLALWLASRILMRATSEMWLATYMMDRMLKETTEALVVIHDLPPTPMLGPLLGASYDQYTREGKRAIPMFFNQVEELHPFINACPKESRAWLRNNGVFRAEGCILHRQLVYGRDDLSYMVWEQVGTGHRYTVLPEEMRHEYLPTIQKHLETLNDCRAYVLTH